MKLSGLQLGLAVSLGVHAALLVVWAWAEIGRHRDQLPDGPTEHVITLTLVSAPEEPAPKIVKPVVVVPSPPERLEPPKPENQPPQSVKESTASFQPQPTPAASPVAPQSESAGGIPINRPTPPSNVATASLAAETRGPAKDNSERPSGTSIATVPAPIGISTPANYRKNPNVPYPAAAERRRLQGVALLRVQVSAQGRVLALELKKTSGYAVLDDAAIQAVRTWEFEPACIGSVAIESQIEVPVRFQWEK